MSEITFTSPGANTPEPVNDVYRSDGRTNAPVAQPQPNQPTQNPIAPEQQQPTIADPYRGNPTPQQPDFRPEGQPGQQPVSFEPPPGMPTPEQVEQQAREQQWLPHDEWRAKYPHLPAENWRPAEEFLQRQPHASQGRNELIDRSLELDELRGEVKHLTKLAAMQFAEGKKTALAELKQQHRAAVINEDIEGAQSISREIVATETEIQDAQRPIESQQTEQRVTQELSDFKSRNATLLADEAFRAVLQERLKTAIPVNEQGLPTDPLNHAATLERVKNDVLQTMPHLAGVNLNRQAPPTSHPSQSMTQQPMTAQMSRPNQQSFGSLNQGQQTIFREFYGRGAYGKMTEAEAQADYVNELKSTGEIA